MYQNLQSLPCLSKNAWLQQKARQYRQVSHATVESTIIWGSRQSVGWRTCPPTSWHGMDMFLILITQSYYRLDWIFCTFKFKFIFFISKRKNIMECGWYTEILCWVWGDQIEKHMSFVYEWVFVIIQIWCVKDLNNSVGYIFYQSTCHF
jgi:hypothetical protein